MLHLDNIAKDGESVFVLASDGARYELLSLGGIVSLEPVWAKLPVGTTFSFNLNAPASVTLAFRQKVGGRMVGKRCVAQTRRNRGKRRCRRTVPRKIPDRAR